MPNTVKVNFESYLDNNPKFLKFAFEQIAVKDTSFQNRILGYGKDMNAGFEAYGAFLTSKNPKMTNEQAADYTKSIESTKKMMVDSNIQLTTIPDNVKIALLENYISSNVMGYPVKIELDKNIRATKSTPIKENNAQMLVKNFTDARRANGKNVVNRQTNDTTSNQDDLPSKNPVEFFNNNISNTPDSGGLLASAIKYMAANNTPYKKILTENVAIINQSQNSLKDFQNANSFTMTDPQRKSLVKITESSKVLITATQAEIDKLSPQAKEEIVTAYTADVVNNEGKVKITLPNNSNKIWGQLPKTRETTKEIVNALSSLQQKNKTMSQAKM